MKKLLIIGGGNMGLAIASGIIKKGMIRKSDIIFVEISTKRISFLRSQKFQVFTNLTNTIKKYNKTIEAILLAVKPGDINLVTSELKAIIPSNTIIISIAAGIKLKNITSLLNTKQALARVMPNTPCQIREGISAVTFNKYATKRQKRITLNIFQSVGKVVELKEDKFNLVTSISGSGPAYFCYLIEQMIKSATKLGLKDKIARLLTMQTAYGTVSLLTKDSLRPEDLRKRVTSPKGTTEAAIKVLEEKKFKDIIYLAIRAAKERSKELGKV